MKPIDISIVTYNSEKWLNSFFHSLQKQKYPLESIHIYITDNNSTDSTYKKLEDIKKEFSNKFASFQVFKRENLGFGAGHNNNISHAKSDFLLVTNVDLEFEPDSLINIVEYALADAEDVASWEFRQKPYEHPKYYNPVTLETNWSSSACILFRKSALDKIGGYEEKIFMYGEDVEISYRLRDHGYRLKYYPKAVCWHYTYEVANQVKELQFLGSTSSNLLLRMRYGGIRAIGKGVILYLGLFMMPPQFPSQRLKLFKNLIDILKKSPYFLSSRKKRKEEHYKFLLWDYEFIRDGAFYNYSQKQLDNPPLVTVIVRTCCQRFGYLKEAVESIKNQTYQNIELVVVEDGTEDAKSFVESIKSDNIKTIKYISMPKAGRCVGGNVGLQNATGKYIVFLDDDDLFFADHLEVLVSQLEENQELGACYTSAFQVATDVKSKNPLVYEEKSHDVIYRQPFSRCLMWYNNYIPIQSIVFKKSLYDQYGGFDESLDNLEDWNLWTRYSMENDFKYIEKTTSLYRVPYHEDHTKQRQEELDSYYQKAVEKQRVLKVEMTPADVVECYRELSQAINMVTVSREGVKNVIARLPFLYRFYNFFKKVYNKMRQKRS
jgi:GT2 family glycosyltransferase